MKRLLTRGSALAAALGLLLAFGPGGRAQGQDLKSFRIEPTPLSNDQATVGYQLARGEVTVAGPNLKQNQAVLRQLAQTLVFPVTFDSYYVIADTGALAARKGNQSFDTVIREFEGRLVVPSADNLSQLKNAQAGFVAEFGAAIDEALRAVFAKNPPEIIRVNAARLLAVAARSGAPAHGKMIAAMLTNSYFTAGGKPADTPPEVLLYALKAAENLLAAHDLNLLGTNFQNRHTLPEGELMDFVKVLQALVVDGPPVAKLVAPPVEEGGRVSEPTPKTPDPKAGDPKAAPAATLNSAALTPDQVAVVRYFRRAAIRALARVRFDVIGGKGGTRDERPAYTLARVAVNDSGLSLPTTAADTAEALIGMANMTPSTALNVDEWAFDLATGLDRYAQPRIAADDDRSIPWKVTSARLDLALQGLRRSIPTTPPYRRFQRPLTELLDVAAADVLAPLQKDLQGGVNRPTTNRVTQWRAANAPKDAARSLFSDDAKYVLRPRAAGQ